MLANKPHIIVVVADSLRYDTVERVPDVLPYLTKRAVQFTQTRSAGCWTLPATASLFTGGMPHEHGADAQTRNGLRSDMPTLAELLKDKGYRTHMLTANTATTGFGLTRGFDRVWKAWEGLERQHSVLKMLLPILGRKRIRDQLFRKDPIARELAKNGLHSSMVWLQDTADDVFAEGLRTLSEARDTQEPCFIFMNLMEAHFPYHIADTMESTSWNPITALREYLALIRLVSQSWLPKGEMTIDMDMLARLRSRQVLAWQRLAPRLDAFVEEVDEKRDTIIVFLSDHGDCFGDAGMAYHFGNVTDGGNRVPLFWVHPEDEARSIHHAVSSRDLFPTLLAEVEHPLGEAHIIDDPWSSRAVMTAHWYAHPKGTHARYRKDQFAVVIDHRPWMFDGRWHRAAFGVDGLQRWIEVGPTYSPIEEMVMDIATRRDLRKALEGHLAFSRAHT